MVANGEIHDLAAAFDEEHRGLRLRIGIDDFSHADDFFRQMPVEVRVGRLLLLGREIKIGVDAVLEPLIDEWLLDGGSVSKLAEITGISRQTLTRRKRKLVEGKG